MLDPGATMSNSFPSLEYGVRPSFLSTAPTAITLDAHAGADILFLWPSFPDAASTTTPWSTALLLDIANVLSGTFLSAVGEQLGEELTFSAPVVVGQHIVIEDMLKLDDVSWQKSLTVEINYRLENCSFNCDLLLLMPEASINYLFSKLDELLDDDIQGSC